MEKFKCGKCKYFEIYPCDPVGFKTSEYCKKLNVKFKGEEQKMETSILCKISKDEILRQSFESGYC